MRRMLLTVLFSLWASMASATVNCTLPFNLQNGTNADATQVMANYNALVACLGQAASAGVNSDITSLLGLTTPISPTGGGSTVFAGGSSTGSANAQVVSATVPTGFTLGTSYTVVFIASFTNTGPMTLTVNGQTVTSTTVPSCSSGTCAPSFYRQSPAGPQPMINEEVKAGQLVMAQWDGTQFELVNITSQFGGYANLTAIPAAATMDLGLVSSHNIFVTGSGATITSFGSSCSTTYPVYKLLFQGAVTITFNGTSLVTIGNTNILTNSFDTADMLCNGSGNWIMLNYTRRNGTAIINPTSLSGAVGLTVANDAGTPNTILSVISDQAVLLAPGPVPFYAASVSVSINTTVGGVNGLDTGSRAAGTWYNLFLISDGNTVAGLASLSAIAPTMPSGYTYRLRVGAMRTDGSANFLRTTQRGSHTEYTTGGVSMATGSNAAWTAVAIGNFVPPTATQIKGIMSGVSMGNNTTVAVAPSNGYPTGSTGNTASTPWSITNSTGAANGLSAQMTFEFILQSSNIYYASNAGSAAAVSALGWTDKVNAN